MSDDFKTQVTQAISLLQDALRKESFDSKASWDDVKAAVNILSGLRGVGGQAPDPGIGT